MIKNAFSSSQTPLPLSESLEAAAAFARRLNDRDPFLAAFRITRTAMALSDPTLPDNPIIYVNAAFEKLTGFSATDIIGRNCRFMQGPDTDPRDVDAIRKAVLNQQSIELDLLNHKRDGTPFWNRLSIAPVWEEAGQARYFVASQLDVTIEKHHVPVLVGDVEALEANVAARTLELAERDAKLRMALAAGGLGTWTLGLPTLELEASAGCKRNFGYAPNAIFTYEQLLASIHSEDLPRMQAEVQKSLETGQRYDIEYRILTPGGEQRWVAVQGELQYRADGSVLAMSGFSTDISDRKFADEHRLTLARELSHRVKNTLATVSAVVTQTLRDAPDMKAATAAVQGRIASMATAHDLLIQDEIDGAPIGEIVHRVLGPFIDASHARFKIFGPSVRLSPQVTLALSMALYELATNAIKYGSLSVQGGTVSVHWLVDEATNRRRLEFGWQEEGGPAVCQPSHSGFGTRMIERVLRSYVEGDAKIEFRSQGVRFTLDILL